MLGFLNLPKNYEEFVVPDFKNRNELTMLEKYDFMRWHVQKFPVVERLLPIKVFVDAAKVDEPDDVDMQKVDSFYCMRFLDYAKFIRS